MPRATEPLVESAEALWITERLEQLLVGLRLVASSQTPLLRLVPQLEAIAQRYKASERSEFHQSTASEPDARPGP
jgi:hypothetical protein